jgi:hypothetical protein
VACLGKTFIIFGRCCVDRVVQAFEEQVNLTVGGTARLVEQLFPHHCVPLYENDTITIPFKYQPTVPIRPGMDRFVVALQ